MTASDCTTSFHRCLKCGETKPRTSEFWVKDHGCLCSPCRLCRRLQHREWELVHAEVLSEKHKIKAKCRRELGKSSASYVLNERLRKSIYHGIRRCGASLTLAKLDLGYTIEELKFHLERQFIKGMSWELFFAGKIHIDHISPLSSFDLSDPAQFKTAWSLPNLRPLWSHDNLSKHAKRLYLL